jgi:predicted transcriptional regulator of viral defense system
MLQDTQAVLYSLQTYKSPKSKITQLIRNGNLIQIRRGLFETNPAASPYALAPAVYGPSYISFEYALGWYGLIPERVTTITSAAFKKNKTKSFDTPFGVYTYRTIPAEVYPYAVTIVTESGYSFSIASAEKALCDTLYKAAPVKSPAEIQELLFDSWRIDPADFTTLNTADLTFLAPRYHTRNLQHLLKLCCAD